MSGVMSVQHSSSSRHFMSCCVLSYCSILSTHSSSTIYWEFSTSRFELPSSTRFIRSIAYLVLLLEVLSSSLDTVRWLSGQKITQRKLVYGLLQLFSVFSSSQISPSSRGPMTGSERLISVISRGVS